MATPTRDYIPVAKGGIWSTARPPVSQETQNLLKVMMKESKLTNFQQRQINDRLKSGQGLPVNVHPTSSRNSKKKYSDQTTEGKKTLNPRNYRGGVRTKNTIQNIVNIQNENEPTYSPAFNTKKITDDDKRKLQNLMAYGQDITANNESSKNSSIIHQQDEPIEVDRFEEVLAEIEERREFLDHMEALGKGKQIRSKILTEISMKIRELERIDFKRSQEVKDSFPADQLSSRLTSPIQ